ncbi:hypothetical protein R6Q57_005186 [Mikania cordata]
MITQDPYGALSSWNHSLHFCDWNGVLCGKRHKRVTRLELMSQGLVGTLSPQLGNLSFLRVLLLGNNTFQGSIPHELGRLSRLRVLVLYENKLNGVIPTNLSSCSNLENLSIGFNKLVGSIPKEISFLSKLTSFAIHYNRLTGGIPSFLGNITSMEEFSAAGNPIGGRIPDTLGHLKNLIHFGCGGCNLYGIIPRSIYNLSLLSGFSLGGNQLIGSLPSTIGETLPLLYALQLSHNNLTGPIPPSISNCSMLTYLELQGNSFRGKLTIDFANLREISFVSFSNNNLDGHGEADELKFIDSLKNCSKLQKLELAYCNLHGTLPRSIGNLSSQLSYLSFEENKLHGNLPSSIGNLVGLTTLVLAYNQFTGNIPSTIGMLQKLQDVGLNNNQLSGPIPDTIGNLSMVIKLVLSNNNLEGHIPSNLGKCRSLNILALGNNKLSGNLPKQILQLPSLSIVLELSLNNLSGSLPEEVGDLNMLTYLILHDNSFSGNIPNTLGGCTSLVFLSLRSNLFQGMIPQSLSFLRGLATLDLSHNNLSGEIPPFLEQFTLESLDLSYNDFEGEVPMLGVFANASAFWVSGNSRLCGGLAELGLPKCQKTKKHKKKEKKFPLFITIGILIASVVLFTTLCFIWHKKKSKGQPAQSSRNSGFLQVSYNQLLKATDGFSEANLISQGGFSSVYKGMLDGDDKFVAIKVVRLENRGAQRSFMRECEAWRHIRHRNLLKIITSCSSVDFAGNDFKAIVYEFMSNGSLNDWLHSSAHTPKLNLLQRINILSDVANALDYLHNHCQATIVHGDLKPSNILLDDDLVAHVGDFGLARFLGTHSNQNSSTGVIGTIGYAPPEYGTGSEMTSSGDVYSFGILLLEVMTGKNPTCGMFSEGLSIHKFVNMSLPDHVMDIIDGDLLNYHQDDANVTKNTGAKTKKLEECLASILKIGVSCSVDSYTQRMNIETVVNELQHVRENI